MKTKFIAAACLGLLAVSLAWPRLAAAYGPAPRFEYATIRWGGHTNTSIIRPDGQVQFLADEIAQLPRPARVDDRAFYMTLFENKLAKDGYEYAATPNPDEVLMRRPLP